jgi:hypothetical protein
MVTSELGRAIACRLNDKHSVFLFFKKKEQSAPIRKGKEGMK